MELSGSCATLPGGTGAPPETRASNSWSALDFLDARKDRFLRGRARKIIVAPDEPAAHLLEGCEARVCTLDDCCHTGRSIAQQEHGARFGIAVAFEANDDAIAHGRLFAQFCFQVLGVNVQAGGRDDHIFSPAFEI